jgi:hypothetical protein
VRKIYSFCTPEIGIHKPLILLIVACGILRGFFHTNRLISGYVLLGSALGSGAGSAFGVFFDCLDIVWRSRWIVKAC